MGAINLTYIANRRKELGITQKNMAKKIGMKSAPAYNKYEKGIYQFNANIIPSLATALQCNINDIFILNDNFDKSWLRGEMMKEEKKNLVDIRNKIENILISENLNFKQAISVLSRLLYDYKAKGDNLLDTVNIEQIISTPRFK